MFVSKITLAPLFRLQFSLAADSARLDFCGVPVAMHFVKLTEQVFHALDWKNPESIDLSKTNKLDGEPTFSGAYGTMFFRY